jgi:hypothetical protein
MQSGNALIFYWGIALFEFSNGNEPEQVSEVESIH